MRRWHAEPEWQARPRLRVQGASLQSELARLLFKASWAEGSFPGAPARVWRTGWRGVISQPLSQGAQDGSWLPRFVLKKPSQHPLHRPSFGRLAHCGSKFRFWNTLWCLGFLFSLNGIVLLVCFTSSLRIPRNTSSPFPGIRSASGQV